MFSPLLHLLKPITMLCSLHQCVKACTACVFLCLVLGVHDHSCTEHGMDSDYGRLKTRIKRDVDLAENKFMKQLFNKYGENGVISFEAFEHLLENLGLGHLHIADHGLQDHFKEGHFDNMHDPSHSHDMTDPLSGDGHEGHAGHGGHEGHDMGQGHDHGHEGHTTETGDHDHGGHEGHGSQTHDHGAHGSHGDHGTTGTQDHGGHQGHDHGSTGQDDWDDAYDGYDGSDLYDIFNYDGTDSQYDYEYVDADELQGDDHHHGHDGHNTTDSSQHGDHHAHASSHDQHDHQMENTASVEQHIFTNDDQVSASTPSVPSTKATETVSHEQDGSGRSTSSDDGAAHSPTRRDLSRFRSRRSSSVLPPIDTSTKSSPNLSLGGRVDASDENRRTRLWRKERRISPSHVRQGLTPKKLSQLEQSQNIPEADSSVYVRTDDIVEPVNFINYRKKRDAAHIGDNMLQPQHIRDGAETGVQRRAVAPDLNQCMSVAELLDFYHIDASQGLTDANLMALCPALIVQLDSRVCATSPNIPNSTHLGHDHGHHLNAKHEGSWDHDHHQHSNHSDEVTEEELHFLEVPLHIWGYAFLAVLVISLVGLLGVAMVPAMQKVFYNHLLQFLVALAVGSLVGDAILHLLPHAMLPHNSHSSADSHGSHSHASDLHGDEHQDHKHGIWVGLTALGGIYFFFITERLMGIFMEWKKNAKRKKKSAKLFPAEESETANIGAKLSKHEDRMTSCEEIMMMVHPHNKDVQTMAENAHSDGHPNCESMEDKNASNHTNLMTQHGHSHHGHTHGELPKTIAAVAWMVIMGDGLHNFSDGLAIGAAFADSLTGGLSTSVAVFCHELPHELGDFAVLLRAGMSVKQAMVYNMVSSVLCLLGMVVGVSAGNIESASSWIFSLAAGMFLYIALVDMLPEMTALDPKKGENPLLHLVLQNLGMITGASIMLLIAIYEEDIVVPLDAP